MIKINELSDIKMERLGEDIVFAVVKHNKDNIYGRIAIEKIESYIFAIIARYIIENNAKELMDFLLYQHSYKNDVDESTYKAFLEVMIKKITWSSNEVKSRKDSSENKAIVDTKEIDVAKIEKESVKSKRFVVESNIKDDKVYNSTINSLKRVLILNDVKYSDIKKDLLLVETNNGIMSIYIDKNGIIYLRNRHGKSIARKNAVEIVAKIKEL